MEDGAVSARSNLRGTPPSQRPLQAGDAAAMGQKLMGTDKWVRVDTTGKAQLIEVDKSQLVQRLWVPFRDLRQLDPQVPIPYPSSIFIRERALVVNLESVRMIIAKDEVYVTSIPSPGSSDMWQFPSVNSQFVRDLCCRLADEDSADAICTFAGRHASKVDRDMPFELRALEAALFAGISVLELAVGNLEGMAFPALDELILHVSRTELDRTRTIKSMTTHLINRVSRVKSEIEEILDDDQDMADMYLGRREDLEIADPNHRAQASPSTSNPSSSGVTPGTSPEAEGNLLGNSSSPEAHYSGNAIPGEKSSPGTDAELRKGLQQIIGDHPASSRNGDQQRIKGPRELRTAHPHDIEDCENLLENYFMQVEFLHSRLMQLKERIDDTEDLINIELDQRRNELVSLDLILTALATAFGLVACVGGIFGMNLAPLPIEGSEIGFWAATFGAIGAGFVVLFAFLGYAYWKKILLIPSH